MNLDLLNQVLRQLPQLHGIELEPAGIRPRAILLLAGHQPKGEKLNETFVLFRADAIEKHDRQRDFICRDCLQGGPACFTREPDKERIICW